MGFLTTGNTEDLTLKLPKTTCIGNEIYFTAKDILEFKEMIDEYYRKNPNKSFNLQDLVNYFNNKYQCNKLYELLKIIVEEGIRITPKLAYLPITEKLKVVNGKFKLSRKPVNMNGFYFLNNFIVLKYPDGTYDFFTDIEVNEETLECDLKNEKINGECIVSYMYLTNLE